MTETRTTSRTGGEKGVKAQRHSLLPKHGLDVISEVFGFGAEKYADHNWRRKYEWSKSYDALQRHLTAWWDGEDNDPESGMSHLGHAGFHILVLATWERLDGQGSEYDDRHTFNRPELDCPGADGEECDGSIFFAPEGASPLDDDAWENVGHLSEDGIAFADHDEAYRFPETDLRPLQDAINRTLSRMADAIRIPDAFVPPRTPPRFDTGAIGWADPSPLTIETVKDAIRKAVDARAPRFVVGGSGETADLHAPIDVPRNVIDALPKHAAHPAARGEQIGTFGGIKINVVDEDPHLDYGDLTREALNRTFARRAHGY